MKKTLAIALTALVGGHFLHAEKETLFFSDFAPDPDGEWSEFPADDGNAPPGWRELVFGQRWVDVDNAFDFVEPAVGSNGFYGEVYRDTGDDDELAWWMSNQQNVGGNTEYTVSFVFRTNTDDGFANNGELDGEARFHVRFWSGEFDFLAEHQQQLVLDEAVIGDEGFPISEDFSEVTVSEPDANGWRTITLSGITPSATLLIDVWAMGEDAEENRFFGSFGIDNVEIASEPGFQIDFPSTTRSLVAVEIEFDTEEDGLYRLESTTDLNQETDEWSGEGDVVLGTGGPYRAIFFTQQNTRWFFRAMTE